MKRMKLSALIALAAVIAIVAAAGVAVAAKVTVNGAGASFPYPVYAQWAYKYEKLTETRLNYQSIGSGGGIAQIKAKTVDFGASDAPLSKKELDEAGLIQFPMIVGGVVAVINVPGIQAGSLKISSAVLGDIFLGKITKWNDAAIAAINPGVKLPDMAVTVVHRADGSGTTWIFTNYLDKISNTWRQRVGSGKVVSWPTGIGGKGNEGVAAYVQRTKGAIGYVEFAYALQNKLNYVQLENKAGKYVSPTIETFQAATANADWANAPGFYMVLTDQPGDDSWPITGASFILVHKAQKDGVKALEMLKFFDWSFNHGQDIAKSLHYVPLPATVISMVQDLWRQEIRFNGERIWK